MNKYAVIKYGSKQFQITEGEEIDLPKIDRKEKEKINFEQVLLLVDGEDIKIGRPSVEGAVVQGSVIHHYLGKKIRIATYKAKSRYRRVKGFRPRVSRVKIEKIAISGQEELANKTQKIRKPSEYKQNKQSSKD
ncbi:MAG TPA: 50S ribosomal protein L21 [Candidatus Bathyarchaeia archaeon]|nr:50S ribosomal protein L21 [Candidatus Bathyarchaeia archaeon]